MNKSKLVGAWLLMISSVSASAFYAYAVWHIFTYSFDELVAPFVMFLVLAPFIPLFFIGVGALALLACVEFAFRYLMQCYQK